MAFNWQTFKTRSLTAVLFVAVMLAGLFINHWTFFILFSIIHFGCWVEYQQLVEKIDPGYKEINPFHRYSVMLAGWCLLLYFTNDAFTFFGLRLHALGWWLGLILVFILPITELLFAKKIQLKNIGHSVFGLVYISLSWALLMDLYSKDVYYNAGKGIVDNSGLWIPIWIIAAIWINDTMAYIVGSLIGKTPFSKISPKKTWEGTIGGALLSILIIGLAAYNSDKFNPVTFNLVIIAAIAATAGTAGDLFESKLKRMAGVKDSGSFMPGHGGFLDRFDSLLLATPFVWLYVKLFMP